MIRPLYGGRIFLLPDPIIIVCATSQRNMTFRCLKQLHRMRIPHAIRFVSLTYILRRRIGILLGPNIATRLIGLYNSRLNGPHRLTFSQDAGIEEIITVLCWPPGGLDCLCRMRPIHNLRKRKTNRANRRTKYENRASRNRHSRFRWFSRLPVGDGQPDDGLRTRA